MKDLELSETCHAVRGDGGPANLRTVVYCVFENQELALMLDQRALLGLDQQIAVVHCC